MNKHFIIMILIFISCKTNTNSSNEFKGYEVDKILISDDIFFDIENNLQLKNDIANKIIKSEKISGPVKGIGIEIDLVSPSDTIKIMSYGGTKYFSYNHSYYKSSENLLPDSVLLHLGIFK